MTFRTLHALHYATGRPVRVTWCEGTITALEETAEPPPKEIWLAPPLVDSEWVAGPTSRLARIILHGVRGPITVKGRKYDMDMPALGSFEDEQIAAIMTYIRREWEHTYSPVDAKFVTGVRKETGNREESWTEAELKKIK